VFPGNAFLEGFPKYPSPIIVYQKFIGANSGSTWGWLLLEGVKNPENQSLE